MNFRNGYLGACIVVLGIMITIVSSYALSIEVTDEEITKYSYVTDLNGLFDSEQSPMYIEYNPSTNFTGYYTNDSIINDTKYFDGVVYSQSEQPNAYRVNLKPENYVADTLSLTPSEGSFDGTIVLWGTTEYNNGNIGTTSKEAKMTNIYLSDFIASLNLLPEQNLINLSSNANYNAVTWPQDNGILSVDWVIFSAYGDWFDSSSIFDPHKILNLYSDAYNEDQSTSYPLPCLSAQIDLTNNQVRLYYDNEFKQQARILQLSEAVISYDGGDEISSQWGLIIGDSVNATYQTKLDVTYMNIKDGVSVEEE